MNPRGSENRKEQTHAEYEVWLFVAVMVVALTGTAALITMVRRRSGSGEGIQDPLRHPRRPLELLAEGDRRWYYTDGTHWYYQDGSAWRLYPFDRGFGREGFERGRNTVPGEGVKVVVPRHEVYRPG